MEVQEYCHNMSAELAGWKAKMYDVVMKLEKLQTAERQRFAPQINALNEIVDDISARIEKLNEDCPADWKPDEKEIKSRISRMQELMKEVWDPLKIGK